MFIEAVKNIPPIDAFSSIRGLAMPFIFYNWVWGNKRHTIMGADPFITIRTDGGKTVLNGKDLNSAYKDPFEALSAMLPRFSHYGAGGSPFNSGAAGYFSYDLKNLIEPRLKASPKKSGLNVPQCIIGLYDPVFIYSHEAAESYIVSASGDKERFSRLKDLITNARPYSAPGFIRPEGFISNTAKEDYLSSIRKAQEYISSGDIYQINLSHRLTIPWCNDPFTLFLKLLSSHPAPFSSFMDFGDFQVISNSPERLIKVEDGIAETSPIKGTRPRGKTPEEDLAMIDELKKSPKECAEHVMIVDLERNDLGRISQAGTVEVSAFESIESYPHLHHMASTVKGRLISGVDSPAALKAIFPGGSVTGAPKIRAMEVIDELEALERGVYTGGIGWLDFNGNMDISMAIRTALVKDGSIHLNVGGGIVADSIPEDEYNETILKAGDFLESLGMGEGK